MAPIVLSVLLQAACATGTARPRASLAPAISASAAVTDRWLGRWKGPEGTSLSITGGNGSYDVTIRDLDGLRSFRAAGADDRIVFTRDARSESIRATDGAATGMKWLADKHDCLTIRQGEGFCRD